MNLKDEFRSLEPSLRRRIKRVTIISVIWAGFILGTAGAFHALKPWMDKLRLDKEDFVEVEEKDNELLATNNSPIVGTSFSV